MKVAVMGAGAIGCYFGAMLARAKHDVVLIGRPQHVDAVNQHGLLLESRNFHGHSDEGDHRALRRRARMLCCSA